MLLSLSKKDFIGLDFEGYHIQYLSYRFTRDNRKNFGFRPHCSQAIYCEGITHSLY